MKGFVILDKNNWKKLLETQRALVVSNFKLFLSLRNYNLPWMIIMFCLNFKYNNSKKELLCTHLIPQSKK